MYNYNEIPKRIGHIADRLSQKHPDAHTLRWNWASQGDVFVLPNGRSSHIIMQPEGKQSHALVFLGLFELLASTVAIWSPHASGDLNPRCSCSYALSGLRYSSNVLWWYNDNSLGFSTGNTGANSLRWPQLSGILYSTWSWLCLVETRCVCATGWSSRTLPSSDICWCRIEEVAAGIWPTVLLQAMTIRAWAFRLSLQDALAICY